MSELFLTKDDLLAAGALDWDAALADIRDALALLRSGEAVMAAENVLPLGPDPRDKGYGLPGTCFLWFGSPPDVQVRQQLPGQTHLLWPMQMRRDMTH